MIELLKSIGLEIMGLFFMFLILFIYFGLTGKKE